MQDTILDADAVNCKIFFLKTYICFAMQGAENFGGKTETRQTKDKGVLILTRFVTQLNTTHGIHVCPLT